jgi:hypothetical protein
MTDWTVIATAAISGGVGFGAAALQTWASRWQVNEERLKAVEDRAIVRRQERQALYEQLLDVLTLWSIRQEGDDDTFTKPFNNLQHRIRLYGSPASIAAVDAIEEALDVWGRRTDQQTTDAAWSRFWDAVDLFVIATRADVGPRPEDGLADVPFVKGLGPRAF